MGWAEGPGPRPAALVWAYAATDFRLLWRHRTPVVFLFLVPAMLSLILGPYVSGGAGPARRAGPSSASRSCSAS